MLARRCARCRNARAGGCQPVHMQVGNMSVADNNRVAAGQMGIGKCIGTIQQVAANDDIVGAISQPDGQ